MARRRLGFLLVLSAIGFVAGIAIGRGAQSAARAPTSHVPTVSASPWTTCFAAGSTCSTHPCVEFVAPAALPRSRQPRVLTPPRTRCAAYPSTRGRTFFIRQ